jgi:hypothetical protein
MKTPKHNRTALPLPILVMVTGLSTAMALAACASDPVTNDAACPTDGNSGGATTTSSGSGGSMGGGDGTGGGETTPPPEFAPQELQAKLHGCRKLRFQTLGNLLVDRGVNVTSLGGSQSNCQTDANGPACNANEQCYCQNAPCMQVGNENGNQGICVAKPATPGFLYQSAGDAFSFPKVDSRRSEKDGHTTASAMRLFDIFIQAAPQIIANIEDPQAAPACVLNGQTHPMFDPVDGSCVEESVSCLLGHPATDEHLLLCDLIVEKADTSNPTDVMKKQHIAVASILSAAHSCE